MLCVKINVLYWCYTPIKENNGDDWKNMKNKHSTNMQIIACKNATKQKTKHFFISYFLSLSKLILYYNVASENTIATYYNSFNA